jgi:hypothetical protein
LYVLNVLLVSRLLLLKAREKLAPVLMGMPRPKFHRSVLVLTAAPPLKAFVPLVSVDVLLRLANR